MLKMDVQCRLSSNTQTCVYMMWRLKKKKMKGNVTAVQWKPCTFKYFDSEMHPPLILFFFCLKNKKMMHDFHWTSTHVKSWSVKKTKQKWLAWLNIQPNGVWVKLKSCRLGVLPRQKSLMKMHREELGGKKLPYPEVDNDQLGNDY